MSKHRLEAHPLHLGLGARSVVQPEFTDEYVITPPGTWHTADVDGPTTAIFLTTGAGTEHRPRWDGPLRRGLSGRSACPAVRRTRGSPGR